MACRLVDDRVSNQELVVKMPNGEDAGAIQRELQLAFRLVHPNICQAFPERDDETDAPFLVLQHGGESLKDRLERTAEPFTLPLAIDVLVSIGDALDYFHDNLVVHLDVSPMNILIDEDDVVRLADFGVSSAGRSVARHEGGHTVLASSVTQLNLVYAAPELHRYEGRARCDQYSLALVFWSLLEGTTFTQRRRFDRLEALSSSQNDALRRALSHDPEDRFESCGAFARAIADASDRAPVSVLARDLERLSRDVLHRFARETGRGGSETTRVGSAVKLGRSVERFLHATLLWMAALDGFDPEAQLRAVDPKSAGLARATAGRIAKTLQTRTSMRTRADSGASSPHGTTWFTARRPAMRWWALPPRSWSSWRSSVALRDGCPSPPDECARTRVPRSSALLRLARPPYEPWRTP